MNQIAVHADRTATITYSTPTDTRAFTPSSGSSITVTGMTLELLNREYIVANSSMAGEAQRRRLGDGTSVRVVLSYGMENIVSSVDGTDVVHVGSSAAANVMNDG